MKFSKFSVRILSLILSVSILIGITPVSVFSTQIFNPISSSDTNVAEDHDKVVLLHEGAKKSSINLAKDSEETLTAFIADINPTNISWQILIPDSNTWVNIQGQNNVELKVSYSIVGSMLNSGEKYQKIEEDTGASTATISRINKCLNYGSGGYRTVLEKIGEK